MWGMGYGVWGTGYGGWGVAFGVWGVRRWVLGDGNLARYPCSHVVWGASLPWALDIRRHFGLFDTVNSRNYYGMGNFTWES